MGPAAIWEKARLGGREREVRRPLSMKGDRRSADEWGSRSGSRAGLVLLLLLLVSYSYFIYRGPIWNADSRMALVLAAIDHRTLSIDAYHEMTEDKSFVNGHYYSDKAVGVSLLAAPVYALLKPSLLSSLSPNAYFLIRYLITFFVISVPSSLLAVLFYSSLPALGVCGLARLTSTVGFALGTIAFPLSTVLYGHQLAASLLFAAFLLLRIHREGALTGKRREWHLLGAAILAGYAVATEYPAAIAVAILSVYAILIPGGSRQSAVARLAIWVTGLAPAGVIVGAYNTLAFGSPLSQGYAHLGGAPQFVEGMSQGLLGLTYPKLPALWGITLSPYRGLFFLSPFLLLAISGWNHLRKSRHRSEAHVCAAIVISFLLFNASYFQWDGGYSLGPRHFTPALPFLSVLAAVGIARALRLGTILVSVSVVMIWLFTTTNAFPSPEYANPLFETVIPSLLSGSLNNNWGMAFGLRGVASLAPIVIVLLGSLALLARAESHQTGRKRGAVSFVA